MNLKKLFGSLTPIACALVLAGCTTVGPDYRIPEDATINDPDASAPFQAAQKGHIYTQDDLPEHWWKLYDDPVMNELVARALANNTDLRVAAANVAKSQAILEGVETDRIPTVGLASSPTFGRKSGAASGSPNRLPDHWTHDSGISVSYQVDFWGKISRAIEAADADVEAQKAAYDLMRITVAANTAKAYADVCSTGHRIDIAKRSTEIQRQLYNVTSQLEKAGRGTPPQTARAAALYENVRSTIPPLIAQQKLAVYRLSTLTGQLPNALMDSVGACHRLPKLVKPIPVGDGATLLKRRPDIRAAERAMAAANARIGVATADLYPTVTLGLTAGWQGRLSDHFNQNAFRWGIGPLISWTIPDTTYARSRIKQSEAEHQAALARFDGTVLNALRETESALTTYAQELDRNATLRMARDQNAKASREYQRLYSHGRIDFMSRLDAERSLAVDEATYAASSAKLINDQISLFLALGGGWEQGEGAPATVVKKIDTSK